MPMLDNRVCGVHCGTVHIEKDPGKLVDLWRACEGWGFLWQFHDDDDDDDGDALDVFVQRADGRCTT